MRVASPSAQQFFDRQVGKKIIDQQLPSALGQLPPHSRHQQPQPLRIRFRRREEAHNLALVNHEPKAW